MAVYFLAEIEDIHDPTAYKAYTEQARPIVARYGGSYVVTSSQCTPVSGTWDAIRVVMIRFESPDQIHACFQSDEYKAIAHLREQSITSKAMILEG